MGAQKSWTGQYAVDCDKVARLPDITFKLDGTDFSLPLSDYIVEVQGTCMSVIAALDVPEPIGPVVTLGDVLLRSYYSIFDLGKGRVGLAMRTSDLTSVLGGI
ncbi:Peptidase A1, partial [Metarhizium hybridum]